MENEAPNTEKTKMPGLMRLCLVIGFLSITVLPMIVLGLAWRQYQIERQAATLEQSAKAAETAPGGAAK